MEYNFDGELRPLTDDLGYISILFSEELSFEKVQSLKQEIMKKYVKYLIDNDPDSCIDILSQHLSFAEGKDYSYVYRPAYLVGVLARKACMSLKFKRVKNDNLDSKDS